MIPFVKLASSIIYLINLALLIYVVLSLLISFKIVNQHQPLVSRIYTLLGDLLEPILKRIRKILPPISGFDLSPIILILLLNFLNDAMYSYLL
jgi:YggT family protein